MNTANDLYEVILIYSGVGYAAICPGIPGAVSQGTDQQDALAMIADAMAMGLMYPLPGDDHPVRRAELREKGKARIMELVAECEEEGLEYYVCQVAPKLIKACSGWCKESSINTSWVKDCGVWYRSAMQNLVGGHAWYISLFLVTIVGFIFLACGADSPTEPETPVPQIVYNDGVGKLRRPAPEITVCERNRAQITQIQTGQQLTDQMYQEMKRYFIPPADPRTPYPEWMAKEFDRHDANQRSASERYQRAGLAATGLTLDAFEYCAGYNDQYHRPRQCQTAFSELIADDAHLNPSPYQLGSIRACLETNAYHREPIGSP